MRTLRAFVWLRWRLMANAFRGGQRRDRLEQISRAVAMVMPLVLIALSFGSVVALTVLGFLGGRALASGLADPGTVMVVLRVALAFISVVILFFAFWLPIQSSLSRYTRLLLLPISRKALHGLEFAAAAADPWIGFIAPGLAAFAIGLAAGGLGSVAVTAAIAGALLLAAFAGLASLIGFGVSWVFRSRRRAEFATILFVVFISVVSFVPALLGSQFENRTREAEASGSFDELERSRDERSAELARWFGWTRAAPSELYAGAVRGAMERHAGLVAVSLAGLATQAILFFFASSAMHATLLGSVETRGRSRGSGGPGVIWRFPPFGRETSAVASAQVRLALRSVRGRLAILLPGPLLAALTVVLRRVPDEERLVGLVDANGWALLGLGLIFAIYSFQPFTMNLFGTDRAGLSLQFLLPISARQLARGKILGIGLVLAATGALCLFSALLVVPVESPALWAATALAGAATYVWLAPVFVWMSALFPVAADLSKTGSGGNPHGFSMLLGTLLVPVAAAPAALALVGVGLWLDQSGVALALMIGWLALALAVSYALLNLAANAIVLRRENLSLVAGGR